MRFCWSANLETFRTLLRLYQGDFGSFIRHLNSSICCSKSVTEEWGGRTREGVENMEVGHMQRQLVEYRKSLFMGGWLDGQFLQLQQLQDENNPDFVFEVVSLFFEDSEKLLNDLTGSMDQHQNIVDFKRVDAYVHQFKGSSSSIGAERVKNACIAFRNFCDDENIAACLSCLQQVKQEYYVVKNKLETLFTLEQQIISAGGSVPIMEFSL